MGIKTTLTLAERIDRAKDGRSQTWIVRQLQNKGIVISEVQFSRRKMGKEVFTEDQLKALSEILSIDL